MTVGRIILEGDEVDPYRLKDVDGVVLIEIVKGQYRVELLKEASNESPVIRRPASGGSC